LNLWVIVCEALGQQFFFFFFFFFQQLMAESKSQEVMLDPARIPAPILPRDLSRCDFEDLDPLEVARQITLLEEGLYR
jgi:hypothetical protein